MTKKYRVLLFLFCVLLLNACGYGTENQEVSTLVRPEESSETDRTSADNRITYEMNTLEEEQEELVYGVLLPVTVCIGNGGIG